MFGYSKIKPGENKEEKETLFQAYNCEKVIIDDSRSPKDEDGAWKKLKIELLKSDDRSLLIDTVFSLGKNGREICKELEWVTANKVVLYVISIPSSFEDTVFSTRVLSELYKDKAAIERKHVSYRQREGQIEALSANIQFGRPATAYPENWAEDYAAWKSKKITTQEFMERSKLKKGTFYNLVKRYKAELDSYSQDIDSIG